MNSDFPRDEFSRCARRDGHSDEFIRQTQEYIDNLETRRMPVIFSLKHFSEIIGISYSKLEDIIFFRENIMGCSNWREKEAVNEKLDALIVKLKAFSDGYYGIF